MRTRSKHSLSESKTQSTKNGDSKGVQGPSVAISPPYRRRRSSVVQSPAVSPVLKRKAIFSNYRSLKLPGNESKRLRQSVDSMSPVLGQRKQPLVFCGGNSALVPNKLYSNVTEKEQHLLSREKNIRVANPSPLCERKINVVNKTAEVPNKTSSRKRCVKTSAMDKENQLQEPLRKSRRTAKMTERFQQYSDELLLNKGLSRAEVKTNSAGKELETSTGNISSSQLDVKQTKEQSLKASDTLSSVLTRRQSTKKGKKENLDDMATQKLQTRSHDTTDNNLEAAPKYSKNKCPRNLKGSSKESLKISNEKRKRSPLDSRRKSTNISVLKEQNSVKLVNKENRHTNSPKMKGTRTESPKSVRKQNVAALSTRKNKSNATEARQQNSRILKTSDVVIQKKYPNDKNAKNKGSSTDNVEKSVVPNKLSSRKSPKTPVLREHNLIKLAKKDSLSVQKNSSKHQDNTESDNSVNKKKPVWASEKITPRFGKRRSVRTRTDVFNFSASPVKDGNKKRKRQCKPRARARATKPRSAMKSALLTTDPSWKNPLNVSSSVTSLVAASNVTGSESTRSAVAEYTFDDCFDTHDNDDDSEVCERGNGVYERDAGDVFENFEGGTASSFVASQITDPLVSASTMPTPVVSKHRSKAIGSSTPRAEYSTFLLAPKEPVNVTEDIAQCFGFEDDDDTTEDDTLLSLSPVRQSGQQSCLNITGTSDLMFDGINQSTTQPYRFSWGSLRPSYHSYATSRSSSMMVHGRSSNRSTASSLSTVSSKVRQYVNSRVKDNSHTKSVSLNKSKKINKAVDQAKPKCKEQTKKSTKDCDTNNKHDESVLFDEEPTEDLETGNNVQAKRSSNYIAKYLSRDPAHRSPEKSFCQPARKSYDKAALQESRRRFIKEYSGAATTEAETEEDVSVQTEPSRRKKTVNRKKAVKKKQIKPSKNVATESSQSTDDSAVLDSHVQKKRKQVKKKKEQNKLEESLHNWASDVNSHFSEIEDCELVVM